MDQTVPAILSPGPVPPDVSASIQRRAAAEHLVGLVSYVRLTGVTKLPAQSLKRGSLPALPPRARNLGAIPQREGRLVILDLDKKPGYLTPDEQFTRLREEFGLAGNGLRVRTPSGGLHLYVLWPMGEVIPKNLRLAKGVSWLNGDIRGGGSLGYVVFPGSQTPQGPYLLEVNAPPALCPPELAERYRSLAHAKAPKKPRDISPSSSEGSTEGLALTPEALRQLPRLLANRQNKPLHSQRATVFRALACCASDGAILEAWSALDVTGDTHSGQPIAPRYLQAEVQRLRATALDDRGRHSRFCPTGALVVIEPQENTGERAPREGGLAQARAAYLKRLKRPTSWKTPAVLDLEKALVALQGGRGQGSKHLPLAFAILEDFVQPWLNHGVTHILLGEAFLSQVYGVDPLVIRQAKRLILRRGILETSVRQVPGRTTAFRVPLEFQEQALTSLLKGLSLNTQKTLVVDWRSSLILDPQSGEIHAEVKILERLVTTRLQALPKRLLGLTLAEILTTREVQDSPQELVPSSPEVQDEGARRRGDEVSSMASPVETLPVPVSSGAAPPHTSDPLLAPSLPGP